MEEVRQVSQTKEEELISDCRKVEAGILILTFVAASVATMTGVAFDWVEHPILALLALLLVSGIWSLLVSMAASFPDRVRARAIAELLIDPEVGP